MHLVFFGSCFFLLLPQPALEAAGLGNPAAFLSPFMCIKFGSMLLPVPGSLGILEGSAMLLLGPAVPAYPLLGALLAYRLVFYLVPFGTALLSMLTYELSSKSGYLALWRRRKGWAS